MRERHTYGRLDFFYNESVEVEVEMQMSIDSDFAVTHAAFCFGNQASFYTYH